MKRFYFRNITALFIKQIKDTLKNLQVLVLFFIFPLLGVVMTKALPTSEMGGPLFFISIFATMHCVFAPLEAAASVIAEEKEKNTLRILIMSNVTMTEYLIAIGGFILVITMLTGATFLFIDRLIMENGLVFMSSLMGGCLVSTVFGMCLGLKARNMSAATAIAMPCGMIFAFVPMLASFNQDIERFSRYTYGQQISFFIRDMATTTSGWLIITGNLLVLLIIGLLLYRRVKTRE
ncbi:MAG: ABC transporter permease [Lachnospiraceae bacterium]|jgi:ABC-2 type transport system permease protein|nr:ABC transporter permease [Lachnospiraceae bacterium]